jgi:hypothetical protein
MDKGEYSFMFPKAVLEEMERLAKPRIRIRFHHNSGWIGYYVMSSDRKGISATWIAAYSRGRMEYNDYLMARTFGASYAQYLKARSGPLT